MLNLKNKRIKRDVALVNKTHLFLMWGQGLGRPCESCGSKQSLTVLYNCSCGIKRYCKDCAIEHLWAVGPPGFNAMEYFNRVAHKKAMRVRVISLEGSISKHDEFNSG